MPDVVSDEDLNALAAEFVLGTLDYDERKGATALLEVDHAFRGIVRIWERRLGELHLMVESVQPDPEIWARIKPQIPGIEQVELAIPSHTPAGSDVVATAGAAAVAEPMEPAPVMTASEASISDATPPAEVSDIAASATASEEVAEGEALTPGRSRSLDETELRLTELAALLPVTQEDTAPPPSPDSNLQPAQDTLAAPEATPEPRIPEPLEAGFVPPVPMAARSAPLVTVAPTPPAEVTVRKVGRGWVVATCLMGVVAVALGGLISAWRYFPERLPEQLGAYSVLNLQAPAHTADRLPPPPPFDE
jgi:hypothetical protein